MKSKKAILAVSFGTSYSENCKKTIGAIERAFARAYPESDVRRAFTSAMIMRKLRERDGIVIDNVREALDRLANDGFSDVVCQPTYVINGCEYDDMMTEIKMHTKNFKTIRVGKPLLSSPVDYLAVTKAISSYYMPAADEALVLMGHGTVHHANSAYAALNDYFRRLGMNNIFVGTVEGYPNLCAIIKEVVNKGIKKALLAPFMVVAGDHANNDMIASESSWKSEFEKIGFTTRVSLHGIGEMPDIQDIYTTHIQDALT